MRIIPRKGPEGLEFEEPLELWLVPSVTTKLEKRLLGVDVVIANETQKASRSSRISPAIGDGCRALAFGRAPLGP